MGGFILSSILFVISYRNVFSEVTGFYFEKSRTYRDILPSSDLNIAIGQFSCIECTKLCADQKVCQTFFYKPSEKTCSFYNHQLMEHTETFRESGIEVYMMKGCSLPGYDVVRKIEVCLKVYKTVNHSYTYDSAVCREDGGELISLDTDLKIDCVSSYLLLHFGKPIHITVGLDNSSGWKWANGQPLAIGHPNVSISLNEYDGNMLACDSNYCGILSVSFKAVRIFDNCCNNVVSWFVCSIPFK